MANPSIAHRALALHDQLEAEGFSADDIITIGCAFAGMSLAMLPLERRAVHFAAHLAGLETLGFTVDHQGHVVVREVGHG